MIEPTEMQEQLTNVENNQEVTQDNLHSFILYLKNQYDIEQQPLMRESEFTAKVEEMAVFKEADPSLFYKLLPKVAGRGGFARVFLVKRRTD